MSQEQELTSVMWRYIFPEKLLDLNNVSEDGEGGGVPRYFGRFLSLDVVIRAICEKEGATLHLRPRKWGGQAADGGSVL